MYLSEQKGRKRADVMEYRADVRGICLHLSKVEAELRLVAQLQGQLRLAALRTQDSQREIQLRGLLHRAGQLEESARKLRFVLRNFTEEMDLQASRTEGILSQLQSETSN